MRLTFLSTTNSVLIPRSDDQYSTILSNMSTNSMATCSVVDNSLNIGVGSCRGGLDFTLLFEESILTIFPLAIVALVAPWRILYLFKRSVKVRNGDILLQSKLVCVQFLIALQTTRITMLAILRNIRNPYPYPHRSLVARSNKQNSSFYSHICSHIRRLWRSFNLIIHGA